MDMSYYLGYRVLGIRLLGFEVWGLDSKYGSFPELGVFLGGPYNSDYSILGSILGLPLFRETTRSWLPNYVNFF